MLSAADGWCWLPGALNCTFGNWKAAVATLQRASWHFPGVDMSLACFQTHALAATGTF